MTAAVDWQGVLAVLASVAVAVVGFAGLLTAFSAANAPLAKSDVVNIRILLIFSLGALLFAILPLPFADVPPQRLWPISTVLLGVFLLFWPIRSPAWNRRRGIRSRRPLLYWGMLGIEAVLGAVLLVRGVTGTADGGTYVLGVAWCLLVATVTFVAQVFALLPVDERPSP
ncbi:MAG TPA: hypothetical protein VFO42_09475 [Sphingomicrobium sp.]|nr:hypothetical protein [Sphingomicrobium sp.]